MATSKKKRWSRRVTQTSDALTLEEGVFTRGDPRSIARSLKRSADRSKRRKADPYRSAMSMLTFYINRAGKNMPAPRRRTLQSAKDELRKLYGKEVPAKSAKKKSAAAARRGRTKPKPAKSSRKKSSRKK